MFALATKNFVDEVDKKGELIPVSSRNHDIHLLTVVVKHNRHWFWQKPKYIPTDFGLNDVLAGDNPIKPDVTETDFLNYSGTISDSKKAAVDAQLTSAGTRSIGGTECSTLKSSFGKLKKEEVELQKLLNDLKDRVLDMSHVLIRQTMKKHKTVLGIVKERILTTMLSSVVEEEERSGQCGGSLSLFGSLSKKVSLKDNASLTKDSNVTIEIPIATTLAYSVSELVVHQGGQFVLCVTSDTDGGFEIDSVAGSESSERDLQKELESLENHFHTLSALPAPKRSSLLQKISELMQTPLAVGALQNALDQVHGDQKPDLSESGLEESQRNAIEAVLDLLGKCDEAASVLSAFHLITSALEEMPCDCLAILRTSIDLKVLQTLELLVQCVSGSRKTPLSSLELEADIYKETKHLFESMNVSLNNEDGLFAKVKPQAGHLPLILCISIRGLASLASDAKSN
ncbi:gasdermin Eb [Oryzias melastigma]|uniref:Gasdermin Eb n=1 Tax=Oryzias melastigma TaxID=30732 RepID=A0A3B3CNQ5_ORYME|nr:gasdermin Eb [Oryzias melastigma]